MATVTDYIYEEARPDKEFTIWRRFTDDDGKTDSEFIATSESQIETRRIIKGLRLLQIAGKDAKP